MPIFKVDIEKLLLGEYWTNRYLCDAVSLIEARNITGALLAMEREFHNVAVQFTKFVVSDNVEGTDQFISVPVNLSGLRETAGELLPLFNAVRTYLVGGPGRQAYKQYRGVLSESDITFNTVVNAVSQDITNAINSFIAANPGFLVDPQGNAITTASVLNRVTSRQLRRGTKRKQNPILP